MEANSKHRAIRHCVIHLGTNHTTEDAPHVLATKLLILLKEVRHNMQNTSLSFSAILPKYDAKWIPGIDQVNNTVQQCSVHIGYSYISHPDFANLGQITPRMLCWDGLHPSYKGVAQLAKDIMK